MVSKKKVQDLKALKELLEEYPVVGVLDMHKLPSRQLLEIRNKLRGRAVIKMVKKSLIILAFKDKLSALEPSIQGEPAIILTKENPFKIARLIQASRSEASAAAGDISPRDIVIPAGPTSFAPGPIIGELQKAKIPAGVEGDKIVVRKDALVARQGEPISEAVAGILGKFGIRPMEIGLNLVAIWDEGTVYGKDVLFIPEGFYLNEIKSASGKALNLSIYINYCTKESISYLLGKAHREGESLSLAANFISPSTVPKLLALAEAKALSLNKKIGR